jgi:hypothetical protein
MEEAVFLERDNISRILSIANFVYVMYDD